MLRRPAIGCVYGALVLAVVGSVAGCSLALDFGGPEGDDDRPDARPRADAESAEDARRAPDATPGPDAPPGQCENEEQDGDETGTDCGGACAPCAVGLACAVADDCVSAACALGTCEAHPRSCASAMLAAGTISGVVTIDGDGTGPAAAHDVYCEQTIAAGGWELVSAVPQGGVVTGGVLQPVVSAGRCLDPAATCAGHVDPAQVSAQTEILILDTTAGDYLILSGFSGSASSSLRYLSRERGLTTSDVCTAPHVCATTTADPGLTLATSGFPMAYTPPLIQWWRYGGWYVGAGPNASLLSGNVFRASYNGNNNLSTRSTAGGTSTFRANGTQRLYARVPAVPTRAP